MKRNSSYQDKIGELLTQRQFYRMQLVLAEINVPDRMQILYNQLVLMRELNPNETKREPNE